MVTGNSNVNNSGCTLDYKNASLKEEEKPEEVEIYEKGWLYMKLDKSSNTLLKRAEPPVNANSSNKSAICIQQHLNNAMNNVIENMEERRHKFIQLYGEDNYERDYKIQDYYEMVEEYDDTYYNEDSDGDY